MDDSSVWYFAYGSNMSPAVMAKRGMHPLDAKKVVIRTHILVFNVFGIPFTEPAMAGIQQRPLDYNGPPVHGVAYLLSASDYNWLKISEGAGTGYREVVLAGEVIAGMNQGSEGRGLQKGTENIAVGRAVKVSTLVARYPFHPAPLPSIRYLNLLIGAAREQSLPEDYQLHLQSLPRYTTPSLHWLHELCAVRMFSGFWHPIVAFVMKRIKARAVESPEWTAAVVNVLFRTMWFYHDTIHRRIWGCDGGRPATRKGKRVAP